MVVIAGFSVFNRLMESLVMLQIIEAVHDVRANIIGAFFAIKAVIAVDVCVFVSVQFIAPFVVVFCG